MARFSMVVYAISRFDGWSLSVIGIFRQLTLSNVPLTPFRSETLPSRRQS